VSTPAYTIDDVVYLKESAGIGFLEAMRVSGVQLNAGGWVYSVSVAPAYPMRAGTYGDRRLLMTGTTIYYSEDELLQYCDALQLALNVARTRYETLLALSQAKCNQTG
jgi:2-keto-4-pentenoate hydratase